MKLNKTQTKLQDLGIDFLVYSDPYSGKDDNDTTIETCERCGGSGYIEYYDYVDNGLCYGCEGYPESVVTYGVLRKRERSFVNRNNRATLKTALAKIEVESNLAKFNEENPGVSDKITDFANDGNSFALSIEKALKRKGTLTEKQLNAVNKMIDRFERDAIKKSLASPVPTGKDVVTGTILSVKWVENRFSYNSGTPKMLVQDDRGFKVFGTAPMAVITGENIPYASSVEGSRVTFNATLEPSKDDDKFGFFKRPTKARLI